MPLHTPTPVAAIASAPSGATLPATALVGLLFALIAATLAIDPVALDAYSAPKWGLVAVGIALAALIAVLRRREELSVPRAVAIGLAIATVLLTASVLASPHRARALSTVASWLALLPVVGLLAALELSAAQRRLLVAASVLLVAATALLSILQYHGVVGVGGVVQLGGRFPSGALLGNEGFVALAAALVGAGAAAVVMAGQGGRARALAAALFLLLLTTILVNQQRTSLLALVAAVLALAVVRVRRWRLLPGLVALAGLLVATPLWGPTRDALWLRHPQADVDRWQALSTDRVGAWVAAVEMARQRPLLGFGPGSYALESTRQRVAVELASGLRLKMPPNADANVAAHDDYLQAAAELGWPSTLLGIGGLLLLLFGLEGDLRARSADDPAALESAVLLAVLVAAAVSALAWFPLQIPLVTLLLLGCVGRAARRVAAATTGPCWRLPLWPLRVVVVIAVLVGAAAALRSWQDDRVIGRASADLDAVLLGRGDGDRLATVNAALVAARSVRAHAPDHATAIQVEGLALIVTRQGDAATRHFRAAIAGGERPEYWVNLGRAYALDGDEARAQRCFLRAAWQSEHALATLPKVARVVVLEKLRVLEAELARGSLTALPDDAVDVALPATSADG